MMRQKGTGSTVLSRCVGGMAILAGALLIASGLMAAAETPPVEAPAAEAPAAVAAAPPAVPTRPVVPPPPEDARAGKVYAVFDEYCARCHQTGRLKVPAAARPLANILALDEVAQDATLVTPGLPDASPLYTILLRQHATAEFEPVPTAPAIQAVRDWIADLPEQIINCGGRPKISAAEVELAAVTALNATAEDKRRDIRFVTLNHLADACVPLERLAAYRQAVTKVVNALSWGPEPIKLEAFGPEETVIKLDLSQLGWVGAHWDKLVQAYPYMGLASSRLSDAVRRQTATATPAVRGDWLAHASMATPLYARLLGLPGRMANLQRILNVDVEADIRSAKARRAGVVQSAITRNNRLVERHPTRTGSLWLAYDFAGSEGRQSILANPLGPTAGGAVKVPFRHDSTRALFTLPNGFFGYSINDARGDRLELSPDGIDRDELSWTGSGGYGGACMGCHRNGPFPVKDAVRGPAEADAAAPADLRDQIMALYAPQGEIDSLVSEDQERYAAAQRRVGIDPDLLVGGLEPVTALAREYTRDVGLHRLASEAGLSVTETRRRLLVMPNELFHVVRRVFGASAPRGDADRLLVRLAPDAGASEAAVVVAPAPEGRSDLELLIWSKSDVYEAGQLASFHARSNQNCHLTLISLDRNGQATVLFPNEFEPNNLLAAGQDMMLPAEGAAYQFRLREKGRETLVGICQTAAKAPEGVQHDFERQRFTMLGDWRAHLGQSSVGTTRAASSGEVARPRSGRGGQRKAAAAAADRSEARQVPDLQARTAISYEVR